MQLPSGSKIMPKALGTPPTRGMPPAAPTGPAPPVYRPQNGSLQRAPVALRPVAPAVYRPQITHAAAPPVYRPNRSVALAPALQRFAAPVRTVIPAVVQRSGDLWDVASDDPDRNRSTPPTISYKVIHKNTTIGERMLVRGTTDEIRHQTAAKRGRSVVNCLLRGPKHPATHWEIMCEIEGLYGKQKFVKFHLTGDGYFSIYNASAGTDSAYVTLAEGVPIVGARKTEDLYRIFHDIATKYGRHRPGANGCGEFATRFFKAVTGIDYESGKKTGGKVSFDESEETFM